MRTQQDSWELLAPSKRRSGGPAYIRMVTLDNLRAMCARFVGAVEYSVKRFDNSRVQVQVSDSEGRISVLFRAKKNSWSTENSDNPLVYLDVLRLDQAKEAAVRARFDALISAPTLWRNHNSIWMSHADIRLNNLDRGINAECKECGQSIKPGATQGTFEHNVPIGSWWRNPDGHQAVPTNLRDACTFCDLKGGNSGPPVLPAQPEAEPLLDGQDVDSPIHPLTLKDMRAKQGTWFGYVNQDLSSSNIGHRQFLQCGVGRTFEVPPKTMPDTQCGPGHRYPLEGQVDLVTGLIARLE